MHSSGGKVGGTAFPGFLVLNRGQLKIISMLKASYITEKKVGDKEMGILEVKSKNLVSMTLRT